VRRDEEGEPEALRNYEDLYIHPARTTQTGSHPLTNFPRTRVSLAEESADICYICNKEKFDWKLKQHFLLKLSNVIKCNLLLYCPSCNTHWKTHKLILIITYFCFGIEFSKSHCHHVSWDSRNQFLRLGSRRARQHYPCQYILLVPEAVSIHIWICMCIYIYFALYGTRISPAGSHAKSEILCSILLLISIGVHLRGRGDPPRGCHIRPPPPLTSV
jgi:hypothetical protein